MSTPTARNIPTALTFPRTLTLALTAIAASAFADTSTDAASASSAQLSGELPPNISRMLILGRENELRQVPGAATFIGPEKLEEFEYNDIQRILRQVPGVAIQVEDGYGLRPNISIRGTPSERSARITLLEDGIPIAPAPYSAPAAYYFPTPGRMQAVEVLKGPAAILQGPYTTGGVVNMVSTQIPMSARGQVTMEAGSHGHLRGHAWYGDQGDRFGYVIEGLEWRADGFQNIDRSSRDTGLNQSDYLARFRINSARNRTNQHSLELKLQYADETSNQTYFGLTDSDFRADPNRRYGLSELDQIETEHEQIVLTYDGQFGDQFELRASAYYNGFERAWFKTEGIDFDGSANAQQFDRTSWLNVVQAVNRGQSLGGFTAADLQAILDGTADTATGSIELRNNSREYESKGIQAEAVVKLDTGPVRHRLRIGTRIHEDEEDRLQRLSTYSQVNGSLVLDDFGVLGNAGNRIGRAEAWAGWLYNEMTWGQLQINPGVRVETMELSRTRWETRDGRTDNPASRDPSNLRSTRNNDLTVVLPGIGIRYSVLPTTDLIFGVHKGFSAPSSDPDTREEESINWEAGLRYDGEWASLELIGFLNDFENLVGVCTASSGANCTVGDLFSGDAARTRGIESRLTFDWAANGSIGLPFEATWTWTDAEFRSDLADTEFFGDAEKGDALPYVPDHQFYVSQGATWERWAAYLSVNYIDSVCTFASCGAFEKTDSLTTLDASVHFELTPNVQLFALGQNLNGEDGIAGRQPRGARPNLDRTFIGGLRIDL